jgi:ABC-2 type transport system ATP-binding protein
VILCGILIITMETAMAAIRADGLCKDYGGRRVVDSVSFSVAPGEFFGFLGPNGAGKSTTIKMLCGLLAPTEGQATLLGHSMANPSVEAKKLLGVLSEEASVYERLSAEELLLFCGQMHGLSFDDANRRTHELLTLFGLEEARRRLIVDYSMGMRKKTALAATLIHGPKVLFLDEPFNGIDPASVRTIRDVLLQLTASGTTIFFTSHVMEVVERLCHRLGVLRGGKLVGLGTLEELRTQAGIDGDLEEVFLTLTESRPEATPKLSWL